MTTSIARLAVDGGTPVRSTPIPSWPQLDAQDIDAVSEVLRSGKVNYWTGLEGREFEREFAATCGAAFAVSVANGTLALELALRSLGIGLGDEVITPCRSFVSSTSSIVACGATPIMADVDRDSQTITAESIRQALSPRTKAILVVHLAGWACEMAPIQELATQKGLKVIEDCAQAQGATYRGRPVGSFGHASAFSFCQDKIMTTGGEGGMMTTHDPEVWERAWSFRDHGRDFRAAQAAVPTPGYKWVYGSQGTNWRMTEMQSALGRRLLARVPVWVVRRQELAGILHQSFAEVSSLRVPIPPADIGHAYYRCYAFVRPERLRPDWSRDRILQAIQAEGIPCFSGSCPEVYRERAFAAFRPLNRLTIAEELGETSLAFLVHPTLSDSDALDITAAVRKVMECASAIGRSGKD